MRVLGGINMIVSAMDDEQIFGALLTRLRDQHKGRGTPQNYFKVSDGSPVSVVSYCPMFTYASSEQSV